MDVPGVSSYGARVPTDDPHQHFAEAVLRYFYPVHYRFGMEMEQAMGQGRISRKQAALIWLVHTKADAAGWVARKVVEARLKSWFEMSGPNVTKVIQDSGAGGTGLVEQAWSSSSARERVLRLTPDGHDFVRGMIAAAQDVLREKVGHVPMDELAVGLAFLQKTFNPPGS